MYKCLNILVVTLESQFAPFKQCVSIAVDLVTDRNAFKLKALKFCFLEILKEAEFHFLRKYVEYPLYGSIKVYRHTSCMSI